MDVGITPPPIPNDPQAPDAGFTLIELAVVVTIIAILTVSVGVSMSFARLTPTPQDDASAFEERFAQLQAQAIYSQTPQGFRITNTGWRIQRFRPVTQAWGEGGRMTRWQNAVFFTKPLAQNRGSIGSRTPDIVLLPDGRSTPFEITFTKDTLSIECRNEGWARMQCTTP